MGRWHFPLKRNEYYLNKKPIGKIVCKRPVLVGQNGSLMEWDDPYEFEVVEVYRERNQIYYITNSLWQINGNIRIIAASDVLEELVYVDNIKKKSNGSFKNKKIVY